jgi:hypothetical protein
MLAAALTDLKPADTGFASVILSFISTKSQLRRSSWQPPPPHTLARPLSKAT